MPGNIKHKVGAGMGGYRGDILSAKQAERVARGLSGGRISNKAITFEGYKDHILKPLRKGFITRTKPVHKRPDLKTWEDRNRENQGTKLNP